MSISNLLTNNLKSYQNLNVNSLFAETLVGKELLSENIQCDTIDTLTFGGDIRCLTDFEIDLGKELRTDTIMELTGLHSVEFPTHLKTDFIEGVSATTVQINDLKSNLIIEATTNNHVAIRRNYTDQPLQEYNDYTIQITSSGADTVLTNWVAGNVGDSASGYLNTSNLVAGTFTIQESGFYATTIKADWNSGNTTTNASFYFRCENTTSSVRDGVEMDLIPQAYTGIGNTPQMNQSHMGYYEMGDVLNVTHYRFGGVAVPVWDVRFSIFRIK